MLAVRNGDAGAFRTLHDCTRSRLRALAVRLLGDRSRAEDVLQEAYLAIWRHAGDYRPDQSAPITWMSAIVRNRCLDALRAPVREFAADTTEGGDESWGDHGDAQRLRIPATGLDPQDADVVRRTLACLPGAYRQALVLAHVHECSHTEVAEQLGVPLGTAKSWIRRGLESLRASYAKAAEPVKAAAADLAEAVRSPVCGEA